MMMKPMNYKSLFWALPLLFLFFLSACDKDDDNSGNSGGGGGTSSSSTLSFTGQLACADSAYVQDGVKVILYSKKSNGFLAVHLYNMRFSSNMNYVGDLMIDSVKYAVSPSGVMTLNGNDLIASINSVIQPALRVSRLLGNVTGSTFTLSMTSGAYAVSYKGTLLQGSVSQ